MSTSTSILSVQGLMKTKLPKLLAHFKAMDVHPTMYSAQVRVVALPGTLSCVLISLHMQWFMTLFTYNFPFSVVVRIWDCVLAEGWKVIFRVALALLKTSEGAFPICRNVYCRSVMQASAAQMH